VTGKGNGRETAAGKKIDGRSSNDAVKAAKGLLIVATAALVWAQTFAFEIGGAVATQDFRLKAAIFAFRTAGCEDPAKVQVSATGEGVLDGTRKSMVLHVYPSSRSGAWAVQRQWDSGEWVVVLEGSCGDQVAGAIVPVRGSGFVREAVRLYPHAPTKAEVDAAIQANQ